jgi:hypothetical protein
LSDVVDLHDDHFDPRLTDTEKRERYAETMFSTSAGNLCSGARP